MYNARCRARLRASPCCAEADAVAARVSRDVGWLNWAGGARSRRVVL